jgi:hypothetical protein
MSEVKKETTHYIDSQGRHVGRKDTIDVRSYERPKRFYRRFEFWLMVTACIVATVLLGLGGCARSEPGSPGARDDRPEPSPVLRSFTISSRVQVSEFRDSAGRICVLALYRSYGVAIDCGLPAPPLDYEQLPEPAVTPIPRSEIERRPQ